MAQEAGIIQRGGGRWGRGREEIITEGGVGAIRRRGRVE